MLNHYFGGTYAFILFLHVRKKSLRNRLLSLMFWQLKRSIIPEVFNGSRIDRYYSDQSIQLRNTSDHTLDIGGLGIGDIFGLAGEINSGYGPNSYASDADYLYFENLWQIPMESSHRYLEPMGCIKIAQDAADHNPYSPLSHFDAHFETYVEMSEQDKDDPVVENLESIYYSAGYDWLVTVFGPTIVIVDSGY